MQAHYFIYRFLPQISSISEAVFGESDYQSAGQTFWVGKEHELIT
jgi:hypothetical protein